MLEPVLNELRADGYLRGESLPPPSFEAGGSHWILALQVIGGWLAAVFMLLFLGMGPCHWSKARRTGSSSG